MLQGVQVCPDDANHALEGFLMWSQHMRSALSRLPTASGPWIWKPTIKTDAPMQADLFGGS